MQVKGGTARDDDRYTPRRLENKFVVFWFMKCYPFCHNDDKQTFSVVGVNYINCIVLVRVLIFPQDRFQQEVIKSLSVEKPLGC